MMSAEHRKPFAAFLVIFAAACMILGNGLRHQVINVLVGAGAPRELIAAIAPDVVLGQSLNDAPQTRPQAHAAVPHEVPLATIDGAAQAGTPVTGGTQSSKQTSAGSSRPTKHKPSSGHPSGNGSTPATTPVALEPPAAGPTTAPTPAPVPAPVPSNGGSNGHHAHAQYSGDGGAGPGLVPQVVHGVVHVAHGLLSDGDSGKARGNHPDVGSGSTRHHSQKPEHGWGHGSTHGSDQGDGQSQDHGHGSHGDNRGGWSGAHTPGSHHSWGHGSHDSSWGGDHSHSSGHHH
jgi:hypothetical protein